MVQDLYTIHAQATSEFILNVFRKENKLILKRNFFVSHTHTEMHFTSQYLLWLNSISHNNSYVPVVTLTTSKDDCVWI